MNIPNKPAQAFGLKTTFLVTATEERETVPHHLATAP